MNVLFVYRAYGTANSNPVIDNQRLSLQKAGITVYSLTIKKGGITGYLRGYLDICRFLKSNRCDLIHAHYAWSGIISSVNRKKPVICSFMGSDLLRSGWIFQVAIRTLYRFAWRATIVKSQEMKQILPKAHLIPNGVDLERFIPLNQMEACNHTGLCASDKNILFIARNPYSEVKNLNLALEAIGLLHHNNIRLHIIFNIPPDELPWYYNAADLLLLTSLSEGSPNTIKEAMACNCPIVSTDVGDIRKLTSTSDGCHISSFNAKVMASKITMVLDSERRTNGRDNIRHLDENNIASHILNVYREVLTEEILSSKRLNPLN